MATIRVPVKTKVPLHGMKLVIFTFAVAFGTFMEVLDLTIVNVSIPNIAGNLGVSSQNGTWVVSSYAVANAISVPLTGWVAKRFGEVRVFIMAVILFSISSLLCGFADSMFMLVTFRLIQGLCSGPMVPLSQSLLLNNYPAEKKGIALSLWVMTIILAPIAGPLLGGWITDNLTWPWIFFINVPIGLLVAALTWWLIRDRESDIVKQPIDMIGLGLVVVGIGCLQLVLDNGYDYDWFNSTAIIILSIIACFALTFLIVWEIYEPHPIIDLTLFKQRNFCFGVICLAVAYFVFFGNNILFPLWLQTVLGYTSTWAGIATAPVGILAIICAPIIGRNLNRVDLRILLTIGFVILSFCSYSYASFTLDVGFNNLIPPRLIQGIGTSLFFIPINQVLLSDLPAARIASASGLANFFRSLAGSFATAIMITEWQQRAKYHHETLMSNIHAYNPEFLRYKKALIDQVGFSPSSANAQIESLVNVQGFMLATSDVFFLSSVLFLCLIPVIWLTKPPFGTGQIIAE